MNWTPLGPLIGGGPIPPPPGRYLPAGDWPQDSPESQGMSSAILATVRGIQHGVVIRHGVNVKMYGNAGQVLDWASCNRTFVDLMWGDWVTEFGFDWLDRFVSELPCEVAHHLPNPGACLKHVCSYTSLPPVGQVWRYSSGDWWPWQSDAIGELRGGTVVDAWNWRIAPKIGGLSWRPGMADDGTFRVKGSSLDWARLGGIMLNGGLGTPDHRIASEEFMARSQAGGPDGTGYPDRFEGYQTHLIRDGHAWELNLPGVPDGSMARDGSEDMDHGHGAVIAIPSLDLIVAARGSTPEWWLPTICQAVQ